MKVVPLEDRHLVDLLKAGAFGKLTEFAKNEGLRQGFLKSKFSFGIEVEGETLAAAGLLEHWQNRAEVWAVMSPNCKPHFLKIHNAVKRFLKVVSVTRIEAVVESDFAPGHRWVKALGFKLEAERLKKYTVHGCDVSLYAIIKG